MCLLSAFSACMYINLIGAQYRAMVHGNIWHFDEPLSAYGEAHAGDRRPDPCALVVDSSPHRLIKLSAGHN